MLERVLLDLQQATAEDMAARQRKPSDNYMADKLRVKFDLVPDTPSFAHVEAQVSSSRSAWLASCASSSLSGSNASGIALAPDETCRGAEWPLTDHPVIRLNWYGPGKFDFGAGWGRELCEFILPLSPDVSIVTQIGSKERGTLYATPEQSRELQQIVVTHALRWVFVRKPAPWIATFRPRDIDAGHSKRSGRRGAPGTTCTSAPRRSSANYAIRRRRRRDKIAAHG